MTEIRVDTITDTAGTGAPDFVDALQVAGVDMSAVNTFQYYSQDDSPEEIPHNGALWWKTNDAIALIYVNDAWYELVEAT